MPWPNDFTDYSTIYPNGETDTKLAESTPDLANRLDRLETGAGNLEKGTGLLGSSDPTSINYKVAAAVTAANAAGTNLSTHLTDPTAAHTASAVALADPFAVYESVDLESAAAEVMGYILNVREFGYPVKSGIVGVANSAVLPGNTDIQNRDRLQALVDHFQGLGLDVPLLFEPNQTYSIARNASSTCGLLIGKTSRVWLDSLHPQSTFLAFTSVTASDTFIKWNGDDAADFSGRCHGGGFGGSTGHGVGLTSTTPSAPTRAIWMQGCDAMDLRTQVYGFGYEAFLGTHWTDTYNALFAADHCGMTAGKYAVTIAPGFNWATDSTTFEHLRLEQCQRDLKIVGGVMNTISFDFLKTEHAEAVNHLEPLVLIDGANIEAIRIHDWQLFVTDVSGGTIPFLAKFKSMSGLYLDSMFISMGNHAICSRVIECEDVFGITPVNIRATLGGNTARPAKGLLHLKGTCRISEDLDVDYNWNGTSRGLGTTTDYGDLAPFGVTKDTGATISFMSKKTANVPPVA